MISSQEQMEIIKKALAEDYKGPIYKLIEEASIQKEEQAQEQPQSQAQDGGFHPSNYSSAKDFIVDNTLNPHQQGMVFTKKSLKNTENLVKGAIKSSKLAQYYDAYIKGNPYAKSAIKSRKAGKEIARAQKPPFTVPRTPPFVAAMLSPLEAGRGSTLIDPETGIHKITGEKYDMFWKPGDDYQKGGLVQSYQSTPPSMLNLPTGDKIGKSDTLINAGRYDHGGVHKRNDAEQAISRIPEIGSVVSNLDWGDAAKTYLNQTFNPTKWFDGKSSIKAAYNELVPLNARLLIEDVADEQLFNKNSKFGKYSPLSYLPEKMKSHLGYKDEVTEKDLSKGELTALKNILASRQEKHRLDYDDYPGKGVRGTTMLEKMTDDNTVLETSIGQGTVTENKKAYNVRDTFDFNQNEWAENKYKTGELGNNLYNYIRWQFAPKYGSKNGDGMAVNITVPKSEKRTGGLINREVLYSKGGKKKIERRKRKK